MEEPEYILPPQKIEVRPFESFQQGLELIKDQYWLFLGMTLLGFMIGGATMYILFGPMVCGIALALIRKRRGEQAQFDQLWKGMDFLNEAIIVSVLLLVTFIISYIGFYIVMFLGMLLAAMLAAGADAAGAIVGGVVMFLVIAVYMALTMMMMLPFLLAFNLIAERGQKGTVALGLAFKGVFANFGGCFALQLLYMLFAMVGVLVCCVGQIFVMPVYIATVHLVCARMFPREGEIPAAARQDPPEPGSAQAYLEE